MRILLLSVCLTLAACATPQERCISNATKDLRTVERLITATERDLRRGFAVDRVPYTRTTFDLCLQQRKTSGNVTLGATTCRTVETRYREVPRAIDRRAEQRKLADLKASRARLTRVTEAELRACAAIQA